MQATESVKWLLPEDRPVLFAQWPEDEAIPHGGSGEVIAYHSATGDIHLLTQDAANILDLVQGQSMSADEITQIVKSKRPPDQRDFTSDDITGVFLEPMHAMGLLDRTQD